MSNTYEVILGSTHYPSYADVATADEYLGANLVLGEEWAAATSDDKGRALVTATRLIDRQMWDEDHDTFDERKVEPAFVSATCELAGSFIAGDTDALETTTTANNIASLRAGTVAISYLGSNVETATRFPVIVNELLAPFLAGDDAAALAEGGVALGSSECTEGERALYRRYRLTRGL